VYNDGPVTSERKPLSARTNGRFRAENQNRGLRGNKTGAWSTWPSVSKQRGGRNGDSGYPMLRLLALVSCGTRTVIDAVFRPVPAGETTCAWLLPGSLHEGMLLLADRNFAAGFLAAQIAAARADFLIRVRTGNSAPKLPVLRRLPDGSWLSRFGGVPVRVIDAEITITTSSGRLGARAGAFYFCGLSDRGGNPPWWLGQSQDSIQRS
jgi:hypothetical protein